MLDKVIAAFGGVFIILLFAICGAVFLSMLSQVYILQDEAQFLARSYGKYGGHTTEANQQLNQFIQNRNLDRSRIESISVSPSGGGGGYWGTPIQATIKYNFPFGVGSLVPTFDVPLTCTGHSVSTYLEGAYNVTYTNPYW